MLQAGADKDNIVSNARSTMAAYGRTPKALLRDGTISPAAKLVVAMVDEVAGYEDITVERLGFWLGLRETATRQAIRGAQAAGWLEVQEVRTSTGQQLPSVYIAKGEPFTSTVGGVRVAEPSGGRVAEPSGGRVAEPSGGRVAEPPIKERDYETRESGTNVPPTPKRGSRIKESFAVDDALRAYAQEHAPAAGVDREREQFVNYWLAASGKNAVKIDWRRAFMSWLNNAQRFAEERGWQPNGKSKTSNESQQRQVEWLASKNVTLEEWEQNKSDPDWVAQLRGEN